MRTSVLACHNYHLLRECILSITLLFGSCRVEITVILFQAPVLAEEFRYIELGRFQGL